MPPKKLPTRKNSPKTSSWKDASLEVQRGPYTKREIRALQSAIDDWIMENEFESRDDGLLYLKDLKTNSKNARKGDWLKIRDYSNLLHRQVHSVAKFCVRKFCSRVCRTGPWTSSEEEHLIELFNIHGPKWKLISDTIGRPQEKIRNKFIQLGDRVNISENKSIELKESEIFGKQQSENRSRRSYRQVKHNDILKLAFAIKEMCVGKKDEGGTIGEMEIDGGMNQPFDFPKTNIPWKYIEEHIFKKTLNRYRLIRVYQTHILNSIDKMALGAIVNDYESFDKYEAINRLNPKNSTNTNEINLAIDRIICRNVYRAIRGELDNSLNVFYSFFPNLEIKADKIFIKSDTEYLTKFETKALHYIENQVRIKAYSIENIDWYSVFPIDSPHRNRQRFIKLLKNRNLYEACMGVDDGLVRVMDQVIFPEDLEKSEESEDFKIIQPYIENLQVYGGVKIAS